MTVDKVTGSLTGTTPARLRVRGVTLGYEGRVVSTGLDLDIPDGAFTAIVGPNACGKSTLMRAMVRLLKPVDGVIEFDGTDVNSLKPKSVARQIAFLPQDLVAPENITVHGLVRRGRFPHQSVLSMWSPEDEEAVNRAMDQAGVTDLAERQVGQLSGGQRQRVWIAMVLAQDTSYLLLDEPTSFLDITHQYELLELCSTLRDAGRTIITVLHDINQACRFADHLVALSGGRIVAQGRPENVVDADLIAEVFGLDAVVVPDPVTDLPMVVPKRLR